MRALKRIYSSFNRIAVHHAKNVLEAEGIGAVVRNEYLSSAMGELPPAECQAELWLLDESDAPRALELLFTRETAGEAWTCACGEISGPQFTQCWRCGAFRRS
jgi:Putative prokaryotic signal transducing protein